MIAAVKRRPAVDPGVGDLGAPVGSREWALGVRSHLNSREIVLRHESETVGQCLHGLVESGGWKHLFREDGTPFASIEEYCAAPKPHGLGMPADRVLAYLQLVRSGQAFKALFSTSAHPVEHLRLDQIRADHDTQARTGTSEGTVAEYAEAMQAGIVFPAVVVFFDGADHWLADGFHRLAAARKNETETIAAEVRPGTRDDAVWHAAGANTGHGLRRSNEDKRRAVTMALRSARGATESNRVIAAHVGVDDKTVASVREEMRPGAEVPQLPEYRVGKDGKKYPVKKKAKAAPEPKPPTFADELAAVIAASPKARDHAIYTAITHAFEAGKITEAERDHLAGLWTKHDPTKTEGAGGLTTSAALTPDEGTSAEAPASTHQTAPASSEKPATPQPMPAPSAPSRGADDPSESPTAEVARRLALALDTYDHDHDEARNYLRGLILGLTRGREREVLAGLDRYDTLRADRGSLA